VAGLSVHPVPHEIESLVREAVELLKPVAAEKGVVLEHHAKDDVPEATGRLGRIETRRYGETQITFYGTRGPDAPRSGESQA